MMQTNAGSNFFLLEDKFDDSISALKYSPRENYLALATWDGIVCHIYIYICIYIYIYIYPLVRNLGDHY